MRGLLLTLMIGLLAPLASVAQAPLRIISFSAEWCPACRVFDPALSRALEDYSPADVEVIRMDMTHLKSGPESREALIAATKARLSIYQAAYLWDWYEGRTGMAVMISSETGEPVACADSRHSTDAISDKIALALILARSTARPGESLSSTDCPAPVR